MDKTYNCEDIYPDIYEQYPVFLSARALQIFSPCEPNRDHKILIATILCNLTGYYFQNLLYRYNPSGDYPEFEEYLIGFANFLKPKTYHNHVVNWLNDQVAERELAERIIIDFKEFPAPPKEMHFSLLKIYSYIKKVLHIDECSDIFHELYNLAASWAILHAEPGMHLASAENILKFAEAQLEKGAQKRDKNYYQFYHWGKEYDHYFQKSLESGSTEKTAHRNARLKFMRNHSPQVDDCDESFPGLTMKSLKKYQTTYLSWRQSHERL